MQGFLSQAWTQGTAELPKPLAINLQASMGAAVSSRVSPPALLRPTGRGSVSPGAICLP